VLAITHGTGTVLIFGGLIFLVIAQLNLGAAWRIGIEEGARTGLVTHGFYRFVRNPIFLASLLVIAGYFLLIPSLFSLIFLFLFTLSVAQQTALEETYLSRIYGKEYHAYARRVGRFFPWTGKLSPQSKDASHPERPARDRRQHDT
jgi:protein-S-isoprenylcysteine O-methyltransferase Ste14